MSELLRADAKLCARCMYRSGNEVHGCNYKLITGKSRIFVDGKMSYPKEYCNKFEEGKTIGAETTGWKGTNTTLIPPKEWPYGFNPYQE